MENNIAKEVLSLSAIDNNLLNIDFWKDISKIKQYCNTIVNFFNIQDININISFSENIACVSIPVLHNNYKEYTIFLPAIQTLFLQQDEKIKQIVARGIFLRHELAHIIFSDIKWLNSKSNDFLYFSNFIEDARIEYLFSNTLKGSKSSFYNLSKIFFNKFKEKIEKDFDGINYLAPWISYTIRGFKFNNTETTLFYQKHFGDLIKNLHTKNIENYKNKVEEIYQLALKLLPVIETLKQKNIKDNNITKSESENIKDNNITKSEDKNDNIIKSEDKNDNIIKSEDKDDNIIKSEDKDDNIIFNDSEIIEHEIKNTKKDKKDKLDINKKSINRIISKDAKNIKEDVEDVEEDVEDVEDVEEDKTYQDLNEIFKDTIDKKTNNIDSIINSLQQKSKKIIFDVEEYNDYKFNINDYNKVSIINLEKLNNITTINIFNGRKKNGLKTYQHIVKNNLKIINETTKYLKLKLQNKNIHKNITNLTEGKLDQNNLKEIIVNKNNPNVFYQSINKITTGSVLTLLIDISSSMNADQIKKCIINVIIFTEICNNLNIDLNIYFFTSLPKFLKLKVFKNSPLIKQTLNKVIEYNIQDGLIDFYTSNRYNIGVIYEIKNIKQKINLNLKQNLGALYNNSKIIRNRLGESTPEFQSLVTVFKENYKNNKNNILFLINDGGYNKDFLNDIQIQSVDAGIYINIVTESLNDLIQIIINRINYKIDFIKKTLENLKDYIKEDILYNNKNLYEYLDCLDKLKNVILNNKELINNELMFETIIKKQLENIDKYICLERFYIHIDKSIKNDGKYFITLCLNLYKKNIKDHNLFPERLHIYLYNNLNKFDIMYRKLISYLKQHNWKIFGIGINYNRGANYIGIKNFISFNKNDNISEVFAKKIREIF